MVLKDVHIRLRIKHDSETLEAARSGHLADDDEVDRFENDEEGGPILDPLKPFWSVPRSPWNAALGELVVSDLVARNSQLELHKDKLLEIFIQCIKTMKGCIQDKLSKPGETSDATDNRVKQELAQVNQAKRIQGRQRRASSLLHLQV